MTQGAVVQLFSSNQAVAQVPSDTVVSANKSSGAFNLSTSPVGAATTVTITARWFGVTRTATVTVAPGTPPAADVVRITKARWKAGRSSDQRGWVTNPQQISVRSNFGGSASAQLGN